MKLVVLGRGSGASLALSEDGERWVLVNASPRLDLEWRDTPALRSGGRAPQVDAVVLLDARREHATGLLDLAHPEPGNAGGPQTLQRPLPPLDLHATPAVFERLCDGLAIVPALHGRRPVRWHLLPVAGDAREAVFHIDGLPGARFTAIAVDPTGDPLAAGPSAVGDAIALHIEILSSGSKVCIASAGARQGAQALHWMGQADCLLVDGGPIDVDAAGGEPPRGDPLAWLGLLPHPRKLLFHAPVALMMETSGCAAAPSDRAPHGLELAPAGLEIEL